MVTRALANQLSDKLIKHDDTFKETLYQCVVDHFASVTTFITPGIAPGALDWLIDTPLLKPVLLRLQQQGIDVLSITSRLSSWQVSDFSHEDIKKLLTPHDCQRLFKQALILRQAETLSNLLLTGHCDQLTSFLNDDRDTPLACFASSGNLPGLEYLLKPGNPQVSQKNIHGSTPLHIAARYGHVVFVRALLAIDGIDVNVKNNNGVTPLHYAALKGHVDCVTELLNTTGIDVNMALPGGLTPLHRAAIGDNVECVVLLLNTKGIDVNVKTLKGLTPLHSAAQFGHAGSIKALLTAPGIDISIKSSDGLTPRDAARKNGHAECERLLTPLFPDPGLGSGN